MVTFKNMKIYIKMIFIKNSDAVFKNMIDRSENCLYQYEHVIDCYINR